MTLNYSGSCSENNSELEELFKNYKFNEWMNFWKFKIPEIDDFTIEKIDTIDWRYSDKINLMKWSGEKEFRKNTLNFSPGGNYITDIYANRSFELKNNKTYVGSMDIDEYYEIVNVKDSLRYHFSGGPYTFYDQSIWLSDSACYILGFGFDDSKANAYNESYSKMIIIKWDFMNDSIIVMSSPRYPYYKQYMRFSTYMNYLYPEYIM